MLKLVAALAALSLSLLAVSAMADAPSPDAAHVMASGILAVAQNAESTSRGAGTTDEKTVRAAISAAVISEIQSLVAQGNVTSAQISFALTIAANAPNISPSVKAVLGAVRLQLASLLTDGPGATNNNGLVLPSAPGAPGAGSGYRGG